jgi:hypothetical protein
VLDPRRIKQNQKDNLLRIFDQFAEQELPSIIKQLKTNNPVRRAIDLAVLQALEIRGDHEKLLDSAYASIIKTIETLATLMKEGRVEE